MKDLFIGKKVIIRAEKAGVFFGKLKNQDESTVVLTNARCIYRWEGALSVLDIAKNGVKNSSKLTNEVDEIAIMNVIEIIPTSEKSTQILEGIEPWKN